ncbi:undecaprenyl-phosphate alpha-N-acetylglucosaminyl 1-phosphate transferase [Bacteroidia bacterium]|nr:undecaprenyl-phosphate alpha-N-acetylglucosaminyl 1-phosphate transferase [Bacteroidia bacterium]
MINIGHNLLVDSGVALRAYPFLFILFSFIIGQILMPYVLSMAKKKNLIVKPNRRTSHEGGIPNIGGINIFSSFIIPYLLFSTGSWDFYNRIIIAGMYIMLLIGFFDDMVELSAMKKLLGEVIVGIILIGLAGRQLTSLSGFLGIHEIPVWLGYLFSLFVFLLVVNALNLIDGVDGLASGLGILICLFFGIYFQLAGDTQLSMMAYSLIGALLIFFLYNVFGNKSKIFMGDSGALVLGYVIYLFVVEFCKISEGGVPNVPPHLLMKAAPVVAVCVLAIPLIDVVRVMVTRIKKGKSPFEADRNHVHHLLLSTGLKHKQVTFILLIVQLIFIILGLLICNITIEIAALIVIVCATLLTITLWRTVDKINTKKINTDEKQNTGFTE